jgi:hypothetical protein
MPFRGSYEQNAQESGGGNWLGFQEVALTDIVDKSADYPDMDMFLEIYFRNENSQYPWKYSLMGTYERDEDGKVKGDSSLLKRILYFVDAIDWQGGVNTKGEWVDKDEKGIDDIAGFLNLNFASNNYGVTKSDEDLKYFIFTYKKYNEKAKKAYVTVCPKIVRNEDKAKADLESYVGWMKANKYIVEHVEGQDSTTGATTATGSAFPTF